MTALTCILAFLPNLGYGELLIIGVVAVLLFGNKLPEVARSLGKSFTEFKRGMNGVRDEWNDALYSDPQ
ncbi:MAG: twin-arginine translocase TatA/TatE family subunit, partial [Planctomycetales bacterium]|nr:twin-arginine translocase TatA/TatE family subunit [Planctomycetales bacterium]